MNDYLLKINTRDRQGLIYLSRVRHNLIQAEEELRKLNEYLTRGGK